MNRRKFIIAAPALLLPRALEAKTLNSPFGELLFGGSAAKPLPVVSGFYNFTGKNLATYFSGLTARTAGTRNVVVMPYGDSTVAGYGGNGSGWAGALPYSWPSVLAGLVSHSGQSSRIGDGNASASSATVSSYDARVAFSGGFAAVGYQTVSILGGSIYQTTTTNALYSFNPGVTVDTFIVGMAASSATGLLQPSLDGGTTNYGSTIGSSAASPFASLYTTVSVPRGLQTLTLKATAGGSGTNIDSVRAYDSTTKEISIWNAGYGGATSAILALTSPFGTLQPITMLTTDFQPDLVIGENGIVNDMNGVNSMTLATSATNNQAIITAVKGYGGSIILMSGPPSNPGSGFASYVTQSGFVSQMKALAYTNNIPFIDVWNLFGGTFQSSLMESDGLHCNATGYAQIAGYANTALNPAFRAA